jgi:hypothetical protein
MPASPCALLTLPPPITAPPTATIAIFLASTLTTPPYLTHFAAGGHFGTASPLHLMDQLTSSTASSSPCLLHPTPLPILLGLTFCLSSTPPFACLALFASRNLPPTLPDAPLPSASSFLLPCGHHSPPSASPVVSFPQSCTVPLWPGCAGLGPPATLRLPHPPNYQCPTIPPPPPSASHTAVSSAACYSSMLRHTVPSSRLLLLAAIIRCCCCLPCNPFYPLAGPVLSPCIP